MEAGRVDADEKLRACADSQFEIWLSGLIKGLLRGPGDRFGGRTCGVHTRAFCLDAGARPDSDEVHRS